MNRKNTDIMQDNKVFLFIALATGCVLMIPFLAMQFSGEMNWDETDFITVGSLLFTIGSLFVLAARKIQSTSNRIMAGIGFLIVLAYIWAELAVGIFTNWGS